MGWNPDHPRPDHVFMWVMCLFVSILIHELGHGLMAEAFGWASEIVLYWCGGLAFSHRHHDRTPWKEIAVALAGPFAGFGFFGLVVLIMIFAPASMSAHDAFQFITWSLVGINLIWGLVNLLPVLPLDGGHVCQHFLDWCGLRDPVRAAMYISIPVSMLAATGFFMIGLRFAGILFAFLCLQNIAGLQAPRSSSW